MGGFSLFFKAKNPRLAKAISIRSPTEFRASIKKVRLLKGFTKRQKQGALNIAKARSRAMLARKNLSEKERKQFRAITKIKFKL